MAVPTTTRAVLENTQFPSLPHPHPPTHPHVHTCTLSLYCVKNKFLELLKQNNSWYVWLTADSVSGIYANLVW